MKINIDDTRFLKTEDIRHKDVVLVESEGVWQESNFKDDDGLPQREFRIHLRLGNGEVRSTTLRSTNVKLLGKALGDETKDWVGKDLRAWKTKSDKAKSGYVFLFVPTDWERDDIGEWIIPEVKTVEVNSEKVDYPEENIDPKDIPF